MIQGKMSSLFRCNLGRVIRNSLVNLNKNMSADGKGGFIPMPDSRYKIKRGMREHIYQHQNWQTNQQTKKKKKKGKKEEMTEKIQAPL